MSLLTSYRTVRNASPLQQLACLACGKPYWIAEGEHDPETCPACRRSDAEAEAQKLVGLVRDLAAGRGVFEILSVEERAEQLAQLGIRLPVNRCCSPVPTMRLVRTMASEVAAELGEPVYDSEGYQPSPEERDDIESRIEAPELEAEEAERWDGLA